MRGSCEHCRSTCARGCSAGGVCYYCQCTMCGQPHDGAAYVSCYTCRSRTHASCVRRRRSRTRDAVSTATATTTTAQGEEHEHAAAATASPPPATSTTTTSATLAATTTTATTSRATRVDGPYFCCGDCAMGVQLCANPQYSATLGAAVERACAQRWAALQRTYNVRHDDGSNDVAATATSAATTTAAASEHTSSNNDDDATVPRLDAAALAAYVQLRYEGWLDYYARELRTHAHPYFFAPAHVHVDETLQSQLHALMTPSGQARRLCLLHAQQHPIGSVIALPSDRLWRGAERVVAGETNSYVAETMALLLDDVAVVVPVYAGAPSCAPT